MNCIKYVNNYLIDNSTKCSNNETLTDNYCSD